MELNLTKIWLRHRLSYKYFNKLEPDEKVLLKNAQLAPKVALLSLKIMKEHNTTLEKSIRLAKRNYDAYLEWVKRESHIYKARPIKPEDAILEFIHQGFVPYKVNQSKDFGSNVLDAIKKLKLSNGSSYIISNTYLQGHLYILPMEFTNNYYEMQTNPGNPHIFNVFHLYGVEGHTKLWITE